VAIELVPLMTIEIGLAKPLIVGEGPAGNRMIFELAAAKFEGDRLRGTHKGNAGADWVTISPDGTGSIDVRGLLETDDGALIYVQYHGRTDLSTPGAPIYTAPRFETSDDRYRWLNKVQAVAKGTLDGSTLTYEIYEVR
jgi:hypothetical protein